MKFDALSNRVIGAALEVHRTLGPGLLESAYEHCFAHELRLNRLGFEAERPLPILYKGARLECGYRIDFLIEGQLIVELKAVEQVLPVHRAQIISYMKLARLKTGLLINFNVPLLTTGIQRFVL